MIEIESENKEIKIKGKSILYYADKNIYGIRLDNYNKMFEIKEIFDNYSQSSLMENNTFLEFKKELLEK